MGSGEVDMLPGASRPSPGLPNPVFLLVVGFLWLATQTALTLASCFICPWMVVVSLDLGLSALIFTIILSRIRTRDTMAMIVIGGTGLAAFLTAMVAAAPYHGFVQANAAASGGAAALDGALEHIFVKDAGNHEDFHSRTEVHFHDGLALSDLLGSYQEEDLHYCVVPVVPPTWELNPEASSGRPFVGDARVSFHKAIAQVEKIYGVKTASKAPVVEWFKALDNDHDHDS